MNQTLFPLNPILLVDDEIEMLKSFELTLRSAGIKNILKCHDSREVMPLLSGQEIEVILLDLTMPFISGDELLPLITRTIRRFRSLLLRETTNWKPPSNV